VNQRGTGLLETANAQISELISLISTQRGGLASSLPWSRKAGRRHRRRLRVTYSRQLSPDRRVHRRQSQGGHHRTAGLLHGHDERPHQDDYSTENIDLQALLDKLRTAQSALRALADLTDEQLDTVPPASDMKFCDGKRALEQVVTNLLKHQSHQLDALRAAIA